MKRILVVDDEPCILQLVSFNLEKAGYKVESCEDGLIAMNKIISDPPDLLVLDLMLPGMDGLEVCKNVRQLENTRTLPIIMLTAKVEEIDRVVGLEIGADDYMTKPFSPRELVARIKSLLRRTQGILEESTATQKPIIRGRLAIYPERYEAYIDNDLMELTPKEFQLLMRMASNPGKVFSRDFLLENIWGYEFIGDTRTVDVHIRHLRKKMERNEDHEEMIETVRGIGYRFKG